MARRKMQCRRKSFFFFAGADRNRLSTLRKQITCIAEQRSCLRFSNISGYSFLFEESGIPAGNPVGPPRVSPPVRGFTRRGLRRSRERKSEIKDFPGRNGEFPWGWFKTSWENLSPFMSNLSVTGLGRLCISGHLLIGFKFPYSYLKTTGCPVTGVGPPGIVPVRKLFSAAIGPVPFEKASPSIFTGIFGTFWILNARGNSGLKNDWWWSCREWFISVF